LASGDSVQIIGWSTVVVPGEPHGLLLGYKPFASMQDTLRLRQLAVALWRTYARRVAEQRRTQWVVLQAQSVPERHSEAGLRVSSTYGVVIDLRADGRWYFHNSGEPVD
jgi:hypothetical protein